MEQLFAVRVLVHYHDKSNVDHAAVRRLLAAAAVDSLPILLTDGTSVQLSSYIQTNPNERKPIADVTGSSGSSLTQVASVFMLAEARAAADALPSSPHELETACSSLERLLGCLATKRPQLPVRDIKQFARVKLGTAARRRAVHRLSRSGSGANQFSLLKAVNAILRLCDVATHCLAVVSRQSVSSKASCETAVALSTRLLTLAASLYEVQKVDTTPALSFFSSNSLRTALVAGAMHLGAISVEHLEIEPMAWIHVANRIVMSNSTSSAPKTSVLSALFGGMIKAAKRYEVSERDTKAAEGALCLLSTLHVVLETDIVRDALNRDAPELLYSKEGKSEQRAQTAGTVNPAMAIGTGAISQAARSFLGERVVSAEEDGDEGRIAARTVYQACEEYAERAGEGDGIMGLLSRLLASAGRQSRSESMDEPVVSISEGTLMVQPDESDASSDGSHLRPESPPFLIDVFDQRSKDGFGASATVGSTSEAGVDHMDRIELHREIGALALDTLAHWVSRPEAFQRYSDLDMTAFCMNICRSAGFFSLGNTSASYELRAAMVDFGSLLGPLLLQDVAELSPEEREARWSALVANLVSSCHKMNPILKSILSCKKDGVVVKALLHAFLEGYRDDELIQEQGTEGMCRLPVESLLNLLLSLISEENSLQVVEALSEAMKRPQENNFSDSSLSYRASCMTLLSHAILDVLGVHDGIDTARIAFAALFNRDVENVLDPSFPDNFAEDDRPEAIQLSARCSAERLDQLVRCIKGVAESADQLCFQKANGSWDELSARAALPRDATNPTQSSARNNRNERLYYHVFWSCTLLHKSLAILSEVSEFSFHGLRPSGADQSSFPLCAPFVCMKALESQVFNSCVRERLQARKQGSITLLYTAECLALTHPQYVSRVDEFKAFSQHGLDLLLKSIVTNVVSIASDCTYDDVASNFNALQRSFQEAFSLNAGETNPERRSQRPRFSRPLSREETCFACLQLGMTYMRRIGTLQMANLLSDVMLSAVRILTCLTPQEVAEVRYLISDVAQILLFLPETFLALAQSIFCFLKQLISLGFPEIGEDAKCVEEAVTFIARVRGFERIVKFGSSSNAAIHLLCKFARDSSKDAGYDTSGLGAALSPGTLPKQYSGDLAELVGDYSSNVSITSILSKLLIPEDESAVAVSAHAQSLTSLTEACEASKDWQHAVFRSLSHLFMEDIDDFSTRLVKRSVMQSATMNDAILMIFDRVIANENGRPPSQILHKAFAATRKLFEKEDCGLESQMRLLNFAARLSVCDGRLTRSNKQQLPKCLLECEIFELIVDSLETIASSAPKNASDPSSKQVILLLCGLLDCFLIGIYGSRSAFFNDSVDRRAVPDTLDSASSRGLDEESRSADGNDRDQQVVPANNSSDVWSALEESTKSSLCTYTTTGSQFVEQHWYFCYTCDLAGSEGVCSVCARICHSGCELAYSKFSRFFCDCGAGSDPQHENASNAMSASEDGDGGGGNLHDNHPPSMAGHSRKRKPCRCLRSSVSSDSTVFKNTSVSDRNIRDSSLCRVRDGFIDSKLRDLLVSEIKAVHESGQNFENTGLSRIQHSFEKIVKSASSASSLIRTALLLVGELDDEQIREDIKYNLRDVQDVEKQVTEITATSSFIEAPVTAKLAVTTKVHKPGCLNISRSSGSPSSDYSTESLICFAPGRNVIAVGQKAGFIEFLDAGELLNHSSGGVEKTVASDYPATSLAFDVTFLQFHPANGNILLVVGREKVSILSREFKNGSWGWDRSEVELGLNEYEGSDGQNELRSACWVEGETASILVATSKFIKLFNVSSDIICPSFFALCPSNGVAAGSSVQPSDSTSLRKDTAGVVTIAAVSVFHRIVFSSVVPRVFVLILSSNGGLYLFQTSETDEEKSRFVFLCNILDSLKEQASSSEVLGLAYHPAESILAVTFTDGHLLCISIALRISDRKTMASVRWLRLFKDALPSGPRTQIRAVPGPETSFLFCQQGQTLKASGVLEVSSNKTLHSQFFGGSPSATVRGMAAYSSYSLTGFPRIRGGFLALDDGSLHRIDILKDRHRPQVAEESILSTIAEHQRIRAMKSSHVGNGIHHGYSAIPSSVGFFEKCRLVSDHIAIEASGTDRRSDSNYERMAVTLAGGGGDCVVSPKENEPFKFTATVDNQAIVLVGARLRFGGTDRSRNRVPVDVKVFGRMVRWKSKNGLKRWLDVPFTVPESTVSPQRVTIELFPRRSLRENRASGDGYAAVDSLELYAVSNIEFTERKLVYENEKLRRYDELNKKQKDSADVDPRKARGVGMSPRSVDDSDAEVSTNTNDQAALLTALNAIDANNFSAISESAYLVMMINNLWSSVFDGSVSRDSQFLDRLLKPCLRLCKGAPAEEESSNTSIGAAQLLTRAAKMSTSGQVDLIRTEGVPMHMKGIERSLFAIGGVARSLLIAGCSCGSFNSEAWSQCFLESMPDSSVILVLFSAFLNMGFDGRVQMRSSYRASSNIVDIFTLHTVCHMSQPSISGEECEQKDMLTKFLVAMMVASDQNLRLYIGQRLLEVCDSPITASEAAGSPFESILATSFVKKVKGPGFVDDVSSSSATDIEDPNEDAGSSQRWAYRCDSCGEVCDQEWWHCNDCEDFDLCTGCLRKSNLAFQNSHNENHLLLRGNVNDEGSEDDDLGEKGASPALISVQRVIGPIINEFLGQMTAESDIRASWRYFDGAETIIQLVGGRSPCEMRSARLKILFDSSFPKVLTEGCQKFGAELDCAVRDEKILTSSPRNAYGLFLILRIMLCTRGSTAPVHIHSTGIPGVLFSLVRSMHDYLGMLARAVSTGTFVPPSNVAAQNLVSWEIWNEPVAGLSYDVLPEKPSLRQCGDMNGMFQMSEELGESSSVFLNLLASVLEALEYCFKAAASASISEQMRLLPRNVLCDIINFSESTYQTIQDSSLFKDCSLAATRVLSALSFEDAEALNDILDKHMYEEQCRRLQKMAEVCGITADLVFDYDRAVEIAGIMASLHKATERHPATWRRFVIGNEGILLQISEAAKALDGQIRVHSLQLLAAGVAVSTEMASKVLKGLSLVDLGQNGTSAETDSQETSEGNGGSDGSNALNDLLQATQENEQVSLTVYQDKDGQLFDYLVHEVMLKSQLKTARIAASHLLISGMLRAIEGDDDQSFITSIHCSLMKGIDLMPFVGDLADGFVDCLRFFVACCQNDLFGMQSEPLLTSMALSMTTSLRRRCSLLVSHPNARLYGRLSGSLDIRGYFLESDPCMSCSASMCESSEKRECRLDTIRAETKYTDCAIMHRLVSTHEVSAISVKVVDPRRSRRAKSIDVLYSSRTVSDAAELKGADHPWRKLRSLELGPATTEASVDLLVPVAASNIKLHFVEFHNLADVTSRDSQDAEGGGSTGQGRRSNTSPGVNDNLQCPRCSRSVTDRHGICRNCHENAYQCRQCRNINYENLDGFLCNECGYCKHGRFEFSVTGRPTFVAERILNEEDRRRASKIIEKEAGNVHRCMEQLTKLRSSIIRSLNSGVPTEEGKDRTRLFSARGGLAEILDSVAPRSSEIAVLEALLEQGHVSQEIEEAANSTHGGISVTEEVIAESNGSADPSERDQNNQTGSGLASPVNRGRHDQSKVSSSHGGTISKTTTSLAATYSKECRSVYATMSRGIRVLTLTRTELVRYANSVGGSRLQYANDIADEGGSGNTRRDFTALLSDDDRKTLPGQRTVCYGCTQSFISKCVIIVQAIMRRDGPATSAIQSSDLAKDMMLVCSLCEKDEVRKNIRGLITYLVNDNLHATQLVCTELARKIEFCVDSFETVDSHSVARFEMSILEATATLDDSCWEERLKLVIRILFKSSKYALTCSSVSESIILPCLRVALRLMRVDSELTAIDSTSFAEGGSGTDAVSNEGLPGQASENSETENKDLEGTMHVALVRGQRDVDLIASDQSGNSGEPPRRVENFEDAGPGAIGSGTLLGNAISALAENQHLGSTRDSIRLDERRQTGPRLGSDVVSGSGAPSSIGTAVDGHLSDDESNIAERRHDGGIDIRAINSMLESDHDSKLLSADVEQWLQGKLDQSSWIAGMKERTIECEQKEKSSAYGETAVQKTYLKTCFEKWRNAGKGVQNVRQFSSSEADSQHLKRLSIEKDNWIVRLMLFTPCTTVRKEACALLELICGQEESLELQLLDVLTGPALHLGADVGEKSKEFFDLLETTLSSSSHRLYLIAKGFLPRLAGLIRTRAEQLIISEANAESSLRLVNFMEGYSLKRLLSLLRQTLEAIPSQRSSLRERLFKVGDYKLVWSLQRAYICVRKLISLRTKLTDDCGSQLCDILLSKDFLFTGPMVTAVVSACVSELRAARRRRDAQAIAILLEQLCLMLCPERKEPICYLSLNKAPTQEEFIRGSMSRNPYPSSSFDGPLMRDVKNKICKDLDLPGLLEDDFAMELLVAGNLVKLDLPIMAVYDHVWRGSTAASMASSMEPAHLSRTFGLRRSSHSISRGGGPGRHGNIRSTILTFRRVNSDRDSLEEEGRADTRTDPPMVVVYRLSGLDGEATEPIVDSVPVESNDEQDAEQLYGDTIVFGEVGGFDVLFDLLTIVGSWGDDAGTAVRVPALRLLRASCEVARNRTLLAKSPDAVSTLLDCAASAFEHAQGSPTAVISAESLLIAAEQILAQQRKELETHASTTPETVSLSSHDPDEVISRIQVFLGRLSVITSPKAEHSILHLLPFLIQGVPGAIDIALEYFHFSWDSIDISDDAQRKAKQLGTVLLATPHDLRGDKFAEQTIKVGIGRRAVEYIVGKFPVPRSANKSQWESSLEYPGPPLVLRLITGLSLFLESRQKQQAARGLLRTIFREEKKIIPVLCQLEMAVSGNAIGTTTEELLEAMAEDSEIKKEIAAEREAIKKARREAAKASRMNILRETGLTKLTTGSTKGDEVKASKEVRSKDKPSVLDFMQELPDEVGPACVVCGDGFRCRPEEALCLYVYCRKVPLDLSAGPHAAVGSKSDENGVNLSQGTTGHVDLELFSSGRSRSQSGLSSRSGANACYTAVTHLNAIHISCHKEASRVDRTSRRDEWDGAFLRNSHTKCNNMFPLRPPITCKRELSSEDQSVFKQARMSYSAAVESYFSRLSSLGRTSLPHSKAVTYDVGRSLLRFADGGTAVFSEHAKGGGPHSNACLIPSMVGLAIYMLQLSPMGEGKNGSHKTDGKNVQTQEAALDKFLKEEEVGDITYYIASALILKPLKTWESCAGLFLGRGLSDGVLKEKVLLRLIAFADLVNRVMKSGLTLGAGQHWLDGLREHIGSDERFGQEFGDRVNERWELYVRKVNDEESFVKALSENGEICCAKSEDCGDGDGDGGKEFVEEMRRCLKDRM